MNLTLAGVAIAATLWMLFKGQAGRPGMIILLMAGSVLTFAATLTTIAWQTGQTLVAALTSFGGSLG